MLFQSTRPRGRTRPRIQLWMRLPQGFNPRVLAGGRDEVRLLMAFLIFCFNPRVLAGGRDTLCNDIRQIKALFQSTRPRGRTRQVVFCVPFRLKLVSIHASSREDATIATALRKTASKFQSTRPRGRTRLAQSGLRRLRPVSIHASSREDATAGR